MFLLLKPVDNLVAKPLGLIERITDEVFVDEYFTMETWLNDNIPVAGEVFRQFVKYLYQQNLLVKNGCGSAAASSTSSRSRVPC